MTELAYDPLSPAVRRDPYSHYRALRGAPGLHYAAGGGFFAVARHRDVLEVLRNPELYSSRAMRFTTTNGRPDPSALGISARPEEVAKLLAALPFPPQELVSARSIIATDPPAHSELRAIVNRGFTPRRIAGLEPRVRAIARACLAEARRKGELDLVADLAIPLPVTVIAELLGVAVERRADFKRWSDAIVASAGGGGARPMGAAAMTAAAELFVYLAGVIDERRRAPREDLLSALVRAEDGAVLGTAEVVMFALVLLVAGNETTTNLLGNAVQALLDHPAALARVQGDPARVPAAIEEVLRWDSPVQALFREVTRDAELAGTALPAGSIVVPLLGSANRDEAAFPDAERFDPERERPPHLSFGFGVHFCLGAALARLEARVALEELLALGPIARAPAATPERVESFMLRGMRSLPLVLERRP